MTLFDRLRIGLRAILSAGLLTFGHVLIMTSSAVAHPYTPPSVEISRDLKATSTLLFLTLLWTIFTLLEDAEVGCMSGTPGVKEDDYEYVLQATAVEFLLGGLTLGWWFSTMGQVWNVVAFFAPPSTTTTAAIHMAYIVSFGCVFGLQAQIALSMIYHVAVRDPWALFSPAFWRGKTGHWATSIALLDDELEAGLCGDEKAL